MGTGWLAQAAGLAATVQAGPVCDSSSDDTEAINAALSQAAGHGGIVMLPAGICRVADPIYLPEGVPVTLSGQGAGITTIQLAPNRNLPVVTHHGFRNLTGSGSTEGLFRVTVKDLTIDGNRSRQEFPAACVAIYGHAITLENLIVQNCKGDGIWSEWGLDSDFRTPESDLESRFINIRTIFNGGDGFVFRGPHDSIVDTLLSWRNSGWGLNLQTTAVNSAAVRLAKVNTYLNSAGGIKADSGFIGEDIAGTTGTGWGMLIGRGAGAVHIVNGTFSGPVALEIRNANNTIQANIVNSTRAGVVLDHSGANTLLLGFFGNHGPVVRFSSPSGPDVIVGGGSSATEATLIEGKPAEEDLISLHIGGTKPAAFTQLPSDIEAKQTNFSNLGMAAGPQFRWCPDCKIESPCASGGTGAWAFFSGSTWKCPF